VEKRGLPVLKKFKSDMFSPYTLCVFYKGEMHSETQVLGLKSNVPTSLTNTKATRTDMYVLFINH